MSEKPAAGFLRDVRSYGPAGGLYQLVDGCIDGVPHRLQVLTRGPGRENAGTRIPIRIRGLTVPEIRAIASGGSSLRILELLRQLKAVRPELGLADLELLLIEMPRPGNFVSGIELDAPGGTADPGESAPAAGEREFSEEAGGLVPLAVEHPLPPWLQFASGAYDEVQAISFALVAGDPAEPTEGGRRWIAVSLDRLEAWFHQQNTPPQPQTEDARPGGLGGGALASAAPAPFTPVDGKVVLAMLWFVEKLKRQLGWG